ncbi:tRNA lysidine(34) synthetase TilS, partial [Streptomyces sp. B15]|nr:tRNA lysidine(34) synthetase TilS [Streptomyces sp. B15]
MGPHPAVAAIRLAVRRTLHDVLSAHDISAPDVSTRGVSAQGAGTHGVRSAQLTAAPQPAAPLPTEPPPPLVLVACSGGADSMALA